MVIGVRDYNVVMGADGDVQRPVEIYIRLTSSSSSSDSFHAVLDPLEDVYCLLIDIGNNAVSCGRGGILYTERRDFTYREGGILHIERRDFTYREAGILRIESPGFLSSMKVDRMYRCCVSIIGEKSLRK